MFAGTDRSATWLAVLYGVGVASVAVLLLWRVGGFVLRSPAPAGAGAVAVIALPVLMLGPLQKNVRPWNAAKVSEPLTGQVIRNGTQLKEIVSFVGNGRQPAEAARPRRPARLAAGARRHVAPARVPAERRRLPRPRHADRRHELRRAVRAPERRSSRWVDASWVPDADEPVLWAPYGCMRRAIPLAVAVLVPAARGRRRREDVADPGTAARVPAAGARPGPRLPDDRRPEQQPDHHRLARDGEDRLAVPASRRHPPRPVVPRSRRRVLLAGLHVDLDERGIQPADRPRSTSRRTGSSGRSDTPACAAPPSATCPIRTTRTSCRTGCSWSPTSRTAASSSSAARTRSCARSATRGTAGTTRRRGCRRRTARRR